MEIGVNGVPTHGAVVPVGVDFSTSKFHNKIERTQGRLKNFLFYSTYCEDFFERNS